MSLEHLNWEDDSDATPKSLNSETLSSGNLTTPPNLTPTNSPRCARTKSRLPRLTMGKRYLREINSSPSDYESSPPLVVYPNDNGTPRVNIRAREIPHRPVTTTPEPGVPPLYRQYFILCGDCACSLDGRVFHEYVSENNN